MDYADVEDAQACLDFCRITNGCNYFSFYDNTKACFAFDNCVDFSVDTCADCISGDSTCRDIQVGNRKKNVLCMD